MMNTIPHFSFSGRNGAYIVWQDLNGETCAVGTMVPCDDKDYLRYGVPKSHKWRVDARAMGHTLTATGVNRNKTLAAWCRLLRSRTESYA